MAAVIYPVKTMTSVNWQRVSLTNRVISRSKLNSLKNLFALLCSLVVILCGGNAQPGTDSLHQVARYQDSVRAVNEQLHHQRIFDEFQATLDNHPFLRFRAEPEILMIEWREYRDMDSVFYFIIGLVLFLALIRLIFPRYMSSLFVLSFRASPRQQQLREQMLQTPLPALLMNVFFVIVLATHLSFLAIHFDLFPPEDFWMLQIYTMAIIAGIYTGKYFLLQIAGWIFGNRNAAAVYLFSVFLVNKITAILLLPLLVMIAFPSPELEPVVLIISCVLLVGIFVYRFIIAYKPLRNEIKLTRLHFFLYICAFEIAPLLLIYKVLLSFVGSSFSSF